LSADLGRPSAFGFAGDHPVPTVIRLSRSGTPPLLDRLGVERVRQHDAGMANATVARCISGRSSDD
jgi:hypothetical protein